MLINAGLRYALLHYALKRNNGYAGKRTRVLTEQIRTVDRRRLGEHVGRLTWEELEDVDRALETVLGLAR